MEIIGKNGLYRNTHLNLFMTVSYGIFQSSDLQMRFLRVRLILLIVFNARFPDSLPSSSFHARDCYSNPFTYQNFFPVHPLHQTFFLFPSPGHLPTYLSIFLYFAQLTSVFFLNCTPSVLYSIMWPAFSSFSMPFSIPPSSRIPLASASILIYLFSSLFLVSSSPIIGMHLFPHLTVTGRHNPIFLTSMPQCVGLGASGCNSIQPASNTYLVASSMCGGCRICALRHFTKYFSYYFYLILFISLHLQPFSG